MSPMCDRRVEDIVTGKLTTARVHPAEFLHSHRPEPIIHRDLKSANLLVGGGARSYLIKLADFGLARVKSEYRTRRSRSSHIT